MERKRNFSCKRRAILEAIRNCKSHPSAECVHDKLKRRYPNLSLATVYRNIAQFKEDGDVVSVGVVNGHDRLDGNTAPHPHFVCRECNSVIDIEMEALHGSICQEINEKYGVYTEHFELTFYGVCPECIKNKINFTEENE